MTPSTGPAVSFGTKLAIGVGISLSEPGSAPWSLPRFYAGPPSIMRLTAICFCVSVLHCASVGVHVSARASILHKALSFLPFRLSSSGLAPVVHRIGYGKTRFFQE